MYPLHKEIYFKTVEWNELKELFNDLRLDYEELANALPCSYDHANQMAYYECNECFPQGIESLDLLYNL